MRAGEFLPVASFFLLLLTAQVTGKCLDDCENSCLELNGNVADECNDCSPDEYECYPGAEGFDERSTPTPDGECDMSSTTPEGKQCNAPPDAPHPDEATANFKTENREESTTTESFAKEREFDSLKQEELNRMEESDQTSLNNEAGESSDSDVILPKNEQEREEETGSSSKQPPLKDFGILSSLPSVARSPWSLMVADVPGPPDDHGFIVHGWLTPIIRISAKTLFPDVDVESLNRNLTEGISLVHAQFEDAFADFIGAATLNDAFFRWQLGGGWKEYLRPLATIKAFEDIAQSFDDYVSRITEVPTREEHRKHSQEAANHDYLIFWATVHSTCEGHEEHNHVDSKMSMVYYVNVPEGSGGIQFKDPREGFHDDLLIQPKAGEFIGFPGWLRHEVLTTKQNARGSGKRISIAWNADGKTAKRFYSMERIGAGTKRSRVRNFDRNFDGLL